MGHTRSLVRAVVACVCAALWLCGGLVVAPASTSGSDARPVRVDITIKAREFHPSPVSVPVGRQVVLVFTNQDAELHAFVPKRFLEGVQLHVEGNGAPQFGEKGLERVLIPSQGREEIHFVPTAVGTFEYRCDLPGHQMVGKIVVEDLPAGQRAGMETGKHAQGPR